MTAAGLVFRDEAPPSNLRSVVTPAAAVNAIGETKWCSTRAELIDHLLYLPPEKRLPYLQIEAAGVSPMSLLPLDIRRVMQHYVRSRTYGMSFLYPAGLSSTPAVVLSCFAIFDAEEQRKLDAQRKGG